MSHRAGDSSCCQAEDAHAPIAAPSLPPQDHPVRAHPEIQPTDVQPKPAANDALGLSGGPAEQSRADRQSHPSDSPPSPFQAMVDGPLKQDPSGLNRPAGPRAISPRQHRHHRAHKPPGHGLAYPSRGPQNCAVGHRAAACDARCRADHLDWHDGRAMPSSGSAPSCAATCP